jgi:hypothetical protein
LRAVAAQGAIEETSRLFAEQFHAPCGHDHRHDHSHDHMPSTLIKTDPVVLKKVDLGVACANS